MEAARLARAQRDQAGLADALELRAATESELGRVREALRESHAIWTEAGAAVEAARILVALGRLPGAGPEERLGGLLAAEHLATAGALADRADRAASVSSAPASMVDRPVHGDVVIQALGRFEVHLGGQLVPASDWQSRKARDLLKVLVARRGRPVPRSELCELLWPDDNPERTGHRLSVLLSIVRGVLDPVKAFATDHFLVADQSSIALDIARVRVDVEDFLAHIAHARRLIDRGALADARTLLMAAERQYRADAFEDEPYADWSGPLREEARAAYLGMLRMLAQVSRAMTGPGSAVEYLLRLLERDPYDESAHRALVRNLVAGGQHGEARRAFARYGVAMRTIGVRPPDEVVLVPARPRQ
jgi:DNA-binding SARP family transcriptional activator